MSFDNCMHVCNTFCFTLSKSNCIYIYTYSLEVRIGNNHDHQSNPLCNWLIGKQLRGSGQDGANTFNLFSCSDDAQWMGRYVSFTSDDAKVPLTLCQGVHI